MIIRKEKSFAVSKFFVHINRVFMFSEWIYETKNRTSLYKKDALNINCLKKIQ